MSNLLKKTIDDLKKLAEALEKNPELAKTLETDSTESVPVEILKKDAPEKSEENK